MTKEVLITISGLQFDASSPDNEPVELIVSGEYYFRNGKHHLVYEEANELSKEGDKCHLKFSEDYMELTKKGVTSTHMIFERGKKNVTYYYTPYGSLLIGIDATKVEIQEKEDLILADVKYGMELNSEHLAECSIHVEVKPKGSPISLQEYTS